MVRMLLFEVWQTGTLPEAGGLHHLWHPNGSINAALNGSEQEMEER